MEIIVVTGKSGAGKTYVSNILKNLLDAEHLSLDTISHQTLTFLKVKNFVRDNFGNDVFDADEINRKKLGAITFKNPELLNQLNKICEEEMEKLIDEHISSCTKKYLILDYMLLPLMKYFDMAKFKILVTASNDTRKQRIIKRDGITEEYFLLRDKHSLSFNKDDYDFVISEKTSSNIETIASKIKAS